MGPEAEHADAQGEALSQARARKEYAPTGVDPAPQLFAAPVRVVAGTTQGEGDDAELGLVEQLEPLVLSERFVRALREGELLRQLVAEGADAVELQGSQTRRPLKSRDSSGERSVKPVSASGCVRSCM